eukprot:COSAG02_NODE_28056_length_597_cov_0.969880_1_plen_86_part_01
MGGLPRGSALATLGGLTRRRLRCRLELDDRFALGLLCHLREFLVARTSPLASERTGQKELQLNRLRTQPRATRGTRGSCVHRVHHR